MNPYNINIINNDVVCEWDEENDDEWNEMDYNDLNDVCRLYNAIYFDKVNEFHGDKQPIIKNTLKALIVTTPFGKDVHTTENLVRLFNNVFDDVISYNDINAINKCRQDLSGSNSAPKISWIDSYISQIQNKYSKSATTSPSHNHNYINKNDHQLDIYKSRQLDMKLHEQKDDCNQFSQWNSFDPTPNINTSQNDNFVLSPTHSKDDDSTLSHNQIISSKMSEIINSIEWHEKEAKRCKKYARKCRKDSEIYLDQTERFILEAEEYDDEYDDHKQSIENLKNKYRLLD